MLPTISSAALRKLVALSKRKEALMARVQEVEREMLQIQRKSDSRGAKGAKPGKITVRRAGRRKS